MYRMGIEFCLDEMNVFGRVWGRVDFKYMFFLSECVLGRVSVDVEYGFIFVLILVRDCIVFIYLDDLFGK